MLQYPKGGAKLGPVLGEKGRTGAGRSIKIKPEADKTVKEAGNRTVKTAPRMVKTSPVSSQKVKTQAILQKKQAFQSMRAAREAKRAAMRSVQTAKQSAKTAKITASEFGILEYVPIIQAIMMQESGGRGTDPMQASECPYNTQYPNTPGALHSFRDPLCLFHLL